MTRKARAVPAHPDSDVYLLISLEPAVRAAAQSTHTVAPASSSRFFPPTSRQTAFHHG
jgi:hypothetical protein